MSAMFIWPSQTGANTCRSGEVVDTPNFLLLHYPKVRSGNYEHVAGLQYHVSALAAQSPLIIHAEPGLLSVQAAQHVHGSGLRKQPWSSCRRNQLDGRKLIGQGVAACLAHRTDQIA